jgi:putative DNA primase/helicase
VECGCGTQHERPSLFRLGNELLRIERSCGEASLTGELTKEKLRYQLGRMANFFRLSGDKVVVQDPPGRLIEDMLAELEPPLPALRAVTDVPIFAANDTLIAVPGYHAESGVYYRPASGLAVPPVPNRPSERDVEKAKRIIDDVLCDFPFAADADRAHAIGLMLLPFVRELIGGPRPLTLISAPTYGAGKGLLAQVCLAPCCGEVAFLPPNQDDNELRKAITSALLENKRTFIVDNVTQLRSSLLAMAITAPRWQDRILGVNRIVSLTARSVWGATGNNVQLSGELMRRCVWIRLLPPCEKPWMRAPQQFHHPRLLEHVKRNRARIVWAALTLIQHWLSKGRPLYQERPLASFEAWSQIMGGILQVGGIDGFLQNQNEFYETADEDSLIARCFVRAWWERYQTRPVLAADLVPLVKDCELLPVQTDDPGLARKLGRWLARNEGRVFDN